MDKRTYKMFEMVEDLYRKSDIDDWVSDEDQERKIIQNIKINAVK
jgi:hypothetical protein